MDYVLLSPNDGELLKKAHQMLLEGGVKDNKGWNKDKAPDKRKSTICLLVYGCLNCMEFYNHDCEHETTIPITLTPENLTESVNTVLAEYKK